MGNSIDRIVLSCMNFIINLNFLNEIRALINQIHFKLCTFLSISKLLCRRSDRLSSKSDRENRI